MLKRKYGAAEKLIILNEVSSGQLGIALLSHCYEKPYRYN